MGTQLSSSEPCQSRDGGRRRRSPEITASTPRPAADKPLTDSAPLLSSPAQPWGADSLCAHPSWPSQLRVGHHQFSSAGCADALSVEFLIHSIVFALERHIYSSQSAKRKNRNTTSYAAAPLPHRPPGPPCQPHHSVLPRLPQTCLSTPLQGPHRWSGGPSSLTRMTAIASFLVSPAPHLQPQFSDLCNGHTDTSLTGLKGGRGDVINRKPWPGRACVRLGSPPGRGRALSLQGPRLACPWAGGKSFSVSQPTCSDVTQTGDKQRHFVLWLPRFLS